MRIAIDLEETPVTARVVDAEDFESLKVVVRGHEQVPLTVMAQLGRLGRFAAGGHVFVERAVLVGLPGRPPDDESWNAAVDRMAAAASARGGTDARGAVRALVEREA